MIGCAGNLLKSHYSTAVAASFHGLIKAHLSNYLKLDGCFLTRSDLENTESTLKLRMFRVPTALVTWPGTAYLTERDLFTISFSKNNIPEADAKVRINSIKYGRKQTNLSVFRNGIE